MPGPAGPDSAVTEDIDFGFDDVPDLHGVLAALRALGPYAHVRAFGQPAVLLLSEELVAAAFRDEEDLPAAGFYEPNTRPVLGRTMQCMTGSEHRLTRALVAPAFRRKLMEGYTADLLEPLAHQLVDDFCRDGHAELVGQFTQLFPLKITTRLLGLPVEEDPRCRRWARELFLYALDPGRALEASAAFTRMLTPVLEHRRTEPADDLLSVLATTEVDGERLTDEEIFAFVRLLFPAGVDTTYLALGNALWALLRHPDQLDRLRAEPESMPWVVEETLRWEPSVSMLQRVSAEHRTWNGIDIPAGGRLLLSLAAAGRDPDLWSEPQRFDIGRKRPTTVAFGSGPHACLGMFLAQAELAAALRALLTRLTDLRLTDPAAVRIGNRLGPGLRGPERLDVAFTAAG